MKIYNIILKVVLCCLLCIFNIGMASADIRNERILIITSYNPDTERTNANLSEFFRKYKTLTGSTTSVCVETMNSKNLSEAPLWKNRMEGLLKKYTNEPPSLIILLGQGGLGVLFGANFGIGAQDSFDGGNGEYEHYRITERN